jgi:N utilization substance protein B
MNEYIEIAKEYSSDKSYVFINGVLNKVVNDLRANNQLFKVVR